MTAKEFIRLIVRFLFISFFIMILWNYSISEIFKTKQITFLQAICLKMMSNLFNDNATKESITSK